MIVDILAGIRYYVGKMLIEARCPIKTVSGRPCGRHLFDVEEGSTAEIIVNCQNKDHRAKRRAVKFWVCDGGLRYDVLPVNYQKQYTIGSASHV